MKYRYVESGRFGKAIIRLNPDGSTTSIPAVEDNTDWQEYQRWVAAGNSASPFDPNES